MSEVEVQEDVRQKWRGNVELSKSGGFFIVVKGTEEALDLKGGRHEPLYIRSWSSTFICSDPHISPASHIFPHSLMDPNVATIIPYIPYIPYISHHPIYHPYIPHHPTYPTSSHISSHINIPYLPYIPTLPHGYHGYRHQHHGGRKKSQRTKSQMVIFLFHPGNQIIFIIVIMVYVTSLRWT